MKSVDLVLNYENRQFRPSILTAETKLMDFV